MGCTLVENLCRINDDAVTLAELGSGQ